MTIGDIKQGLEKYCTAGRNLTLDDLDRYVHDVNFVDDRRAFIAHFPVENEFALRATVDEFRVIKAMYVIRISNGQIFAINDIDSLRYLDIFIQRNDVNLNIRRHLILYLWVQIQSSSVMGDFESV